VGQFPPVLVPTSFKNYEKRCRRAVGKPRLDMRLLMEFKVLFDLARLAKGTGMAGGIR
jgi:hypothetical protein